MNSRRTFLKAASLGLACTTMPNLVFCSKKQKKHPNVVLIITDDQGYGDLGTMGNPVIETPHLDALARQSAEMTRYYVHPVCAPTRACLMTGRYNYRTRAIDTYIGRAMMEPAEVTMAELFKQNGYATGIFGKWHLGDNYPMRPQDQGFEEVLVHRGGGIGQPSDPPGGEGRYTDPVLFHNGEQVQMSGYCTDIYFHRAVEWMKAENEKGRPFFVYLATNAPHTPLHDVPRDLYEKYKNKDLGNDQFPQEKGHPLDHKADQDRMARLYAMITNIDENVGRLLAELDKTGLDKDTLVLFMVDNGPQGRRFVSGFKGAKGTVYEGGIRSPLFVRWNSVLKAGHQNNTVVAHIDILPTVMDACRLPLPQNVQIDGKSFWPLLKGETVDRPDRHIVIQAHRGDKPVPFHNFAILTQEWKLLHASGFGRESFAGGPQFELYHMEKDPMETQNVAAEHPEKVKALQRAYLAWLQDVSGTRPDNYAPPRIHIGTEHENPVTLTRQDWRHDKGRPWAEDSNGHWLLYVAESGTYRVTLRSHSEDTSGRAELEIGSVRRSREFTKADETIVFKDIPLESGNIRLKATLYTANIQKGPWQADVYRQK